MRYALAVLTHGDNAEILANTIRSFDQHVSPPPVQRFIVQDGPCALPPIAPYPWTCLTLHKQFGYCDATRALWNLASQTDAEYVFWLEHDFDFRRTIDVDDIATVLDRNDQLAQIALVRDSVNDEERDAGGVVAKHRARGDRFVEHTTDLRHWSEQLERECPSCEVPWLEQWAYFTTNPSLMTSAFMREHPWPDYPSECEGRFSHDLFDKGFSFGLWGRGEPWVDHTGTRTGKGY